MFSVEDLHFAQKYPFSLIAKRVVKESNLSLDSVSEEIIGRARAMALSSWGGKSYRPNIVSSRELLEQEVLAFPVAKILVSLAKNDLLARRFCEMNAKRVFGSLEGEKNDALFQLAQELGIEFSFPEKEDFFAMVSVPVFLSASFAQDFMKLANQKVSNGFVFLSRNEFCRLVAFSFEQKLALEFPLETGGVPKKLQQAASGLKSYFFEKQFVPVQGTILGGIKPEFFPACLQKLYSDILGGRKLSHLERFSLATCMLSLGVGERDVVNLYRATPNFDEKITAYQVSRLAGKTGKVIQAPSCKKMAEYGLRLPTCPCVSNMSIKHPLSVYRRQVLLDSKEKKKP
ncbi:MAG: hypothetical protein HY392_02785 [Candidatus Diapherotrites archaeon]|nr:hypothetical protein [Candidatus Diapherotrites archaeon]